MSLSYRHIGRGTLFMMVRVITLLLLCLSTAVLADESMIKNLRKRMVHFSGDQAMIKSFPHRPQSYIYDQALAIIAFSKARERESARKLLRALEKIQAKDGSLAFSYILDGRTPYPAEVERRFAGAIAWVALAATHYQSEFSSTEFVKFNKHVLSWLRSEMKTGPLRFSPVDLPSTPWKENETAALEHNLDAYAAFSHFARLNPSYSYTHEIKSLRKFILSMWDKDRSHFWSGMNLRTGKINKDEIYLDNQSWSILALIEDLPEEINAREALSLNCDSLYVEHKGIAGFTDSKPTNGPKRYEFVWSEGTLGQILAMRAVGHECHKKKSFVSEIRKMKKEDGGIAYATSSENPDFTTASSVAGTAWMYFAAKGINPFTVTRVPSVAFQTAKTSHRAPSSR